MCKRLENFKIDETKAFQFYAVDDTGPNSGACCPHCGAEGRYIYVWFEYGVKKAAMAGCYAALTGKIKLSDVDQFIQRTMEKVAKSKPLSGWNKTVVRMLDYIAVNGGDSGKVSWAEGKIREAVADNKAYSFRKR